MTSSGFSADKSPYKTNCSASVGDGYLALSARELKVASGLYVGEADELQRYRAAVAAEASGVELAKIVGALRAAKYEITAHDVLKTAPKGWSRQQGHRDDQDMAHRRVAGQPQSKRPRGQSVPGRGATQ